MLSQFKTRFAPPVFLDDKSKTRIASQVHLATWFALLLVIMAVIIRAFFYPSFALLYAVLAPTFSAFFSIQFLLYRGQVRWASHLFVLLAWLLFNYAAWYTGGIRSIGFTAGNFLVILGAGLWLGYRYAFGWVGMGLVAGAGLLWAESLNWLSYNPDPTSLYLAFLGQSFFFLTGAGVVQIAISNVNASLHQAQNEIVERRLAEERLRMFRMGIERSGEAIFMTDVAGKILYVNAAFEKIYGYSVQEAIGQNPRILKSGLLDQAVYEKFWVTLLSKQVVSGGLINRAKDGRLVTVEGSANPILDEDDQIVGFLAIQRDMTEHLQAEERQQANEIRFRAMIENSADGIVLLARDGSVLYESPASLRINGYSLEERIGRPGFDLVHPEDLADARTIFARASKTCGVLETGQLRIFNKAGVLRWLEYSVNNLLDDAVVQGVVINYRDITERKLAEQAVRLREEQYRRAITAADAVPYLFDFQTQSYTFMGEEIERLVGYTAQEITPRTWFDLVQESQMRGVAAHLTPQQAAPLAVSGELYEWKYDMHVKVRDGTLRWIADSSIPVRDATGRVTGEVGILQDITDRKQREHELQAVATVSAALRSARTRAEILPLILEQTCDLLHSHTASIAFLDQTTNELVTEAVTGTWSMYAGSRVMAGAGIRGQVVKNGTTCITNDLPNDPRVLNPSHVGDLRSLICVPLITDQKNIGCLTVGGHAPFTDQDLRVINAIADIAANAIQRVELHEQTERRLQHVQALHEIDRAIASTVDLHAMLDVLLFQIVTQLHADATNIQLVDAVTQQPRLARGRGFRTETIEQATWHLDAEYAKHLATLRHTIAIPNLQAPTVQDLNYLPASLLQFFHVEGIVAYFAVPLVAKGQLNGVLEVFFRAPVVPDADWDAFLNTLAQQAAIAIDNISLFTDLQISNEKLTRAYDALIEGWSRALDLRDRETEGHSHRVTDLTVQVARAMGISETELAFIRRGALLHDIGKIAISDSILLKPGPLTEEEWNLMRRHPYYAHELLAPIEYLHQAMEIPDYHHERWDGTGYPRGLAREQIPLAARAFAVVDVWDALTSNRPYRPAWDRERALDYIRSMSGSQFDPRVVESFFQIINNADQQD